MSSPWCPFPVMSPCNGIPCDFTHVTSPVMSFPCDVIPLQCHPCDVISMVSCPCDVIHVMPPHDVIPLMSSPVMPSLGLGDCDCGVPSAPAGSSQLVVRGGLAWVLQQLLLKVPGLLGALDHAIPWTVQSPPWPSFWWVVDTSQNQVHLARRCQSQGFSCPRPGLGVEPGSRSG